MDEYYITSQVMDDILDNVNRKLSNCLTTEIDQSDPTVSKLSLGLTGGLLGNQRQDNELKIIPDLEALEEEKKKQEGEQLDTESQRISSDASNESSLSSSSLAASEDLREHPEEETIMSSHASAFQS